MQDKFRFPCRSVFALWLMALFALARPAHAQIVLNPAGGSANGTLNATQTDVNYSYTAAADEDARLTLSMGAGVRGRIYFYDSDGATGRANTSVIEASTSGQLGIAHLAPGATYFVHVVLYDGAGTYTLSSSVTAPAFANDAEPNNDPSAAKAFAVNTTKTGHLGYSRTSYTDVDTQDWYSFVAPQDGDVTFTLTTDSVFPLRARIYFIDSDGATGRGNTGVIEANTSGNLTIPHLAPGATYYVLVIVYDGYGGYRLKNVLTPPAVANDSEGNDDPPHALPLAVNTTKTGHLGYSRTVYTDVDTQDWYKVTVPKDGDVTYTLTVDPTLRARIFFYDSDGATGRGNTSVIDSSASGPLGIAHLAPGTTYYVLVILYDGYGGYTLGNSESLPAITTAATPDNSPATALPFAVNGTVTGHLGYSFGSYTAVNANEWYSFVATQDGDVTFTLTTDNALPLRARIYFFDSDGATNRGNTGVIEANTSGSLTVPHLAPGATYYVLIQRYDYYGGYTLTNTFTPPALARDAEVNDTPAQAVNTGGLPNVTGHLGYSRTAYTDVDTDDWYTVTVSQNGDATFTLTTDSVFPLRAQIYFYDSDGATIRGNTGVIEANTSGSLTIPHLAPGATYFARVYRYDLYGSYRLRTTLAPVSNPIKPIPGTTAATAAPFAPNSTITGNLGYSQGSYTDVSANAWYSFVAPRDGDVTFTLTTDIKLPLRAILYFFDSDGVTQRANTGVVEANTNGKLTIGHLAPGATYYVLVQRYDLYGGYTLNNTVAPLFVANDKEPDDSAGQANLLTNLVNITGHLGYSRTAYTDVDTQDWYKIALPAGNFQANISLSGSLRSVFYLFGTDGASQLTNSGVVGSGGTGQINYNIPTAGTYYLLVTDYDGYGAYDINQPVTATIFGKVSLELIDQSAPAQTINVEFRPQPSGTAFTRQISVGYNGAYFIPNVPRAVYDLAFKGAKWLRRVVPGIDVTVGDGNDVSPFLLSGDCNNDNFCDTTDFGIFVSAYNSSVSVPGSGYDIRADFNCDGSVDPTDFGILVGDYNQQGDN